MEFRAPRVATLLFLTIVLIIYFVSKHTPPTADGLRCGVNQESVSVFVGTRPEAIKLAPVVSALHKQNICTHVVDTGQHSSMLRETAEAVGLLFTSNLKWKRSDDIGDLFIKLFRKGYEFISFSNTDLVMVQGDTTTALAVALAASYLRVPVVHVEAGLRTYDFSNPFPEEINRRIIDHISSILFPPTDVALAALSREGIDRGKIFQVGNTVVDALHASLADSVDTTKRVSDILMMTSHYKLRILITCHRRETQGWQQQQIMNGVRDIAGTCKDDFRCAFVFPMHKNPEIQRMAKAILSHQANIILSQPFDYKELVYLYKYIDIIVTDSGGIQEEATALGIPTIVVRNITERPEGTLVGILKLVNPSKDSLKSALAEYIEKSGGSDSSLEGSGIYGEGNSGEKIAEIVEHYLRDGINVTEPKEEQAKTIALSTKVF